MFDEKRSKFVYYHFAPVKMEHSKKKKKKQQQKIEKAL